MCKKKGCKGKVRYDTKKEATKILGKNKTMKPYLCEYCGFWHLGHFQKLECNHSNRKIRK